MKCFCPITVNDNRKSVIVKIPFIDLPMLKSIELIEFLK